MRTAFLFLILGDMYMESKILITGITGNVGSEVAKILIGMDQPVKGAARNITNIEKQYGGSIDYVKFDFEDPNTYDAALKDVSRIFLIRPPQIGDVKKYINPFIDRAKMRGIKHIVFLSIIGADKNPFVPHNKIEKHLKTSGIAYTFLRASFFMQNLSTFYKDIIKYQNDIFIPAGKGKTSFIDIRDIAEIAVKAFFDSTYRNNAYSLTGSEALDYFEVANIFTDVLGRKIIYSNPSSSEYKTRMKILGEEKEFIKVMANLYFAVRLGIAAVITDETRKLLRKPPITMMEFVRDYSNCWR